MDAIFSILPQSPGASSAIGSTAPDTVEDGAFAALLAGQTAPITPVPAVTPRTTGTNAFASTTQSEAGSVLTTLANLSAVTTGATNSAGTTAPNANAANASLPTSPTTGDGNSASQSIAEKPATTGAVPQLVQASSGPPNSGGQVPAEPGQTAPASLASNSATGTDSATRETGNQPAVKVTPSKAIPDAPIKNNVTAAQNGAANTTNTASPTGAETTNSNAAMTPPTPNVVTVANSQVIGAEAATVAAAIAAPVPQVQAGVQARREAAGFDKPSVAGSTQTAKSTTTSTTGNASSPTPTTAKPEISIPAPQASAPQSNMTQSAETPIDPARLVAADAGRHAPAPLDGAQTDSASDGERLDMSSLRAAETARAAERPGTAAGTARFTPANAGSLAAQIAAKFQNGDRKFEIRMDPPELGRIQVKMQVSNDNRVQAILSAERPETLNDMRQHARELERALEEAGLQLDHDGLSFELSQGGEEQDQASQGSSGFSNLEFAEDLSGPITATALPRELYGFHLAARSSVDVRL